MHKQKRRRRDEHEQRTRRKEEEKKSRKRGKRRRRRRRRRRRQKKTEEEKVKVEKKYDQHEDIPIIIGHVVTQLVHVVDARPPALAVVLKIAENKNHILHALIDLCQIWGC
jgi:hypothetical protein